MEQDDKLLQLTQQYEIKMDRLVQDHTFYSRELLYRDYVEEREDGIKLKLETHVMKEQQAKYIASLTQLRREWMESTQQEYHNYLVEVRRMWEFADLSLERLQEAPEHVCYEEKCEKLEELELESARKYSILISARNREQKYIELEGKMNLELNVAQKEALEDFGNTLQAKNLYRKVVGQEAKERLQKAEEKSRVYEKKAAEAAQECLEADQEVIATAEACDEADRKNLEVLEATRTKILSEAYVSPELMTKWNELETSVQTDRKRARVRAAVLRDVIEQMKERTESTVVRCRRISY